MESLAFIYFSILTMRSVQVEWPCWHGGEYHITADFQGRIRTAFSGHLIQELKVRLEGQ